MRWPKSTFFSFLLYFLVTYFENVNCDDGLCGIEPPTVAGASCSGPTDDAVVKVNLCQKLLFLHQITHNMTDLFIELLQVQFMKIPSSEHG